MPVPRIDDIAPSGPRHGAGSRLWAEWCFVRVCLRHLRLRLLLMVIIVGGGGAAFKVYEPENSLTKSAFYTFSLIFGESIDHFPEPIVLQVLCFVIPVLGLTIIIEGIVDFSLVLRDRRRYEKSWCVMLANSFHDHVILIGLGRLGYRVFLTLRRLGKAVVVIEADPNNAFLEEVRRDGSPLIIGDARQEALLEEANVARAAALIVATSDDLANLEASLDARKINPEIRVVLRMFDQNMADKVADGFNLHLAMSQSAISAPLFASCAIAPASTNSCIVGDEVVVMQRYLVRKAGPLAGKTIAHVMSAYAMLVVQHLPVDGEPTLCPNPETELRPGDGLLLQGALSVLERFRRKAVKGAMIDGGVQPVGTVDTTGD